MHAATLLRHARLVRWGFGQLMRCPARVAAYDDAPATCLGSAAAVQAKEKDREGSADAPPRKAVSIELTRPLRAAPLDTRLPSVSIAAAAAAAGGRVMPSRFLPPRTRRRNGGIDEVGIAYSHSNEPWQMYKWPFVIDRGFARSRCTALKFEGRALFLETQTCAAANVHTPVTVCDAAPRAVRLCPFAHFQATVPVCHNHRS
jgi:hypothetical protein